MLTVFFDLNDIVHHEFLPWGQTVNKEYNFNAVCVKKFVKNARICGKSIHDNTIMHWLTAHYLFVNFSPKYQFMTKVWHNLLVPALCQLFSVKLGQIASKISRIVSTYFQLIMSKVYAYLNSTFWTDMFKMPLLCGLDSSNIFGHRRVDTLSSFRNITLKWFFYFRIILDGQFIGKVPMNG